MGKHSGKGGKKNRGGKKRVGKRGGTWEVKKEEWKKRGRKIRWGNATGCEKRGLNGPDIRSFDELYQV